MPSSAWTKLGSGKSVSRASQGPWARGWIGEVRTEVKRVIRHAAAHVKDHMLLIYMQCFLFWIGIDGQLNARKVGTIYKERRKSCQSPSRLREKSPYIGHRFFADPSSLPAESSVS